MHITVVRITLCMYICLYSIVHSFVCDPVLILVKPAPIGCPIKCLSLFEFVILYSSLTRPAGGNRDDRSTYSMPSINLHQRGVYKLFYGNWRASHNCWSILLCSTHALMHRFVYRHAKVFTPKAYICIQLNIVGASEATLMSACKWLILGISEKNNAASMVHFLCGGQHVTGIPMAILGKAAINYTQKNFKTELNIRELEKLR